MKLATRWIAFFVVSAFAVIVAAGCESGGTGGGSTAPPSTGSGLKVALLTTGPVTDHGWNEAAYDGLQKIKTDLGAQVQNQETDSPSQFESALRGFASQGYNLIIAHGDEYADSAAKVAKDFPQVDFVTTGGDKVAPNLAPIIFATEQGAYIQGMQAAFLSKTGKGGFVGGQSLPPVAVAADAFAEGAKSVNPKFTVAITYINSWDDTQKAKAQTEALMAQGADMISHNCDAAAVGLFQAANKPGVYSFGVNSDQNAQAPNVLSSNFLDIPNAFETIAKSVQAKQFKGEPLYLGMKDGDIKVIDNPSLEHLFTPAQTTQIKQAEADIESGKIDLRPKTL